MSVFIEQAVYTSASTDRTSGYQIVAHSPGIEVEDLRMLAAWGPSHDSLWDGDADAGSINFFTLPSGAFCVARTTAEGSEFSGRGERMYSQCLVVTPETLDRFSNNPFALVTAAIAQGSLRAVDKLAQPLETIRLGGRAVAVDQRLLAQLAQNPGVAWLGWAVQATLQLDTLAIASALPRQHLVAGILNCLPVECRVPFSFSTGLRYSPRRTFRILGIPIDEHHRRRSLSRYGIDVLEAPHTADEPLPEASGWGHFVACALAMGKANYLASELARPRPGLKSDDLDELARELTDAILAPANSNRCRATTAESSPEKQPTSATSTLDEVPDANGRPGRLRQKAPPDRESRECSRRAVSNLVRRSTDTTSYDHELNPSEILARHRPDAAEKLETLDDTVFEAIAGRPRALDELRELWPAILSELGANTVEESRQQYLRHALTVWRQCVEGDNIRNPALAVAAADVVCLLLDTPAA